MTRNYRKRKCRWVLYGACLAFASPERAHASTSSSGANRETLTENERAREQFRLGINAFRAGRLEEAREFLSEAWHLRRTYDVAASLAQVENELGHHARAAELLDFCLSNFAPIESDAKLQQLRQAFELVRARVARVDSGKLTAGTRIFVDGKFVGAAPLDMPLYVEPGQHEFVLRTVGATVRHAVALQPGAQHELDLDSEYNQPNGARVPERRPVRKGESGSGRQLPSPLAERPRSPSYVGAGLVVVGAAAGVGFQLAANRHENRVSELKGQIGTSSCAESAARADACRTLTEARADQRFSQNLAYFGFGLAATAALTTVVYWLWPEQDTLQKPTRTRGVARLSIGYEASRLWIGGSGTF